jgi:leucyl-tRNA synthetase
MDNFLDSARYFLRYISAHDDKQAFDTEIGKKWLPVDMYVGGNEHAVLHLMYTRFITMTIHDMGLIDFDNPFKKFRANGMILKDGKKMSKSKGNVINPEEYGDKV